MGTGTDGPEGGGGGEPTGEGQKTKTGQVKNQHELVIYGRCEKVEMKATLFGSGRIGY